MKKILVISTVVVISIIFTLSWGWAQEGRGGGRLVGVVKDSDGNPLEGVQINLEYLNFDHKLSTVSDKKGNWGFIGLGKGMIKLTAVKEGFLESVHSLDVSGVSQNPKQFITMKPISRIEASAQKGDESRDIFMKATALFKERNFEAALALFLDFREQQPTMYKIGINIGNCYLELQRFDEAIKEFQAIAEKIIAENPEVKGNTELAKIYASIGDTYMRQNKFDQAMEFFKKSIEIDQSDHALPYNVAEILFAAGKTDEAIEYYNMAIRIKPDWPKSYMQIGYAYLNKGDTGEAVKNLKKFLELDPQSPEADGVKEVIKSLQ